MSLASHHRDKPAGAGSGMGGRLEARLTRHSPEPDDIRRDTHARRFDA